MSSYPFIQPRKTFGPSKQSADAPLPPRRKSSLACTPCRARKSKCDAQKPFCSTCIRSRQRCVYENLDGRKRETWRSAISDLEQKNEQLEAILATLKGDSFDEAVSRLRQLREGQSADADGEKPGSPGPVSTLKRLSRASSPEFINTRDIDLPPEDVTRQAVAAFFACGGTLFYIMPQEECDAIINAVYREFSATRMMIGQLCALAVVGGHYCTDEIPVPAKEKYFHHASALLQDEAVEDDLGMMRVHACLSIYLVLLKSTSARTMTLSGLNIGRSNMQWYQDSKSKTEEFLDRARVLRTLSFIECWISTTLRYQSDLKPAEIDVVRRPVSRHSYANCQVNKLAASEAESNPSNQISRSLVQSQVFKIAMLSAETYETISARPKPCMSDLKELSTRLDIWLWELPESMRLGSLTSANRNFDAAKRPLLFLHMIHVTSQITLYEQVMLTVLKRVVDPADELLAREVFRLPSEIHQTYEAFAQQLARMIRLLYEEDCILARCWLTIHACYHAILMLMFSAAWHLALDDSRESALQDLSHAQVCLQAFRVCEDFDIAAMRLVDIVVPLYQRLVETVESDQLEPTYALADDRKIPPRLAHIVHQSVAAMELPYQEIWV
ncbi:hypothetical protein BDV18DRAFT_142214, partial [Aspergillus unguis]